MSLRIRFPRKPWERFITPENERFVSPEAIDFIDKCLRYDHMERLTAREAMGHPWFERVRAEERKLGRSCPYTH